jgi:hypothetical protein
MEDEEGAEEGEGDGQEVPGRTTAYTGGWRAKFVEIIHTKQVQTFLLVLLVLDVFLVITEIIVQSHKQAEIEVIEREFEDAITGLPTSCGAENLTFVGKGQFMISPQCTFKVFVELPHNLHVAEQVLSWISFGILVVFALELVLLFVCLCRKFFTVMYVLDTVIIGASLGVHFLTEDTSEYASLIIFIRTWRFARILHGVGLSVHDHDEEMIEEAKDEARTAKKEVEERQQEIAKLQHEIQVLSPQGPPPPAPDDGEQPTAVEMK